jgi:acyl carrier protein
MSETPAHVDADIFDKVQEAFCEALELDEDEVTWDARILDDLGAESLDLLDVVFRLERAFDVQIPRGGLEAKAKEVDGEPGEVDGRLTEAGAARLRELMPEVPAAELQAGMKTSELGRVFRVGTFYNIVKALLEAKGA